MVAPVFPQLAFPGALRGLGPVGNLLICVREGPRLTIWTDPQPNKRWALHIHVMYERKKVVASYKNQSLAGPLPPALHSSLCAVGATCLVLYRSEAIYCHNHPRNTVLRVTIGGTKQLIPIDSIGVGLFFI